MEDKIDILKTPISYLPKVGPQRSVLLDKELGISTFGDLASYLPFRYIDKTIIHQLCDVTSESNTQTQFKVKFLKQEVVGEGKARRFQVMASDGTGMIKLIWFNAFTWLAKSIKMGEEYIIFGKVNFFGEEMSMAHPEFEIASKFKERSDNFCFQGVYSVTEKLSKKYITSKMMFSFQRELWKQIKGHIKETLPAYLVSKLYLMSREEALYNAHFPQNLDDLNQALYRLKFEELFSIQLSMLRYKYIRHQNSSGYVFKRIGENFNNLYQSLPFQLTESQKKVIKEIRADMGSSYQMNRLLQGDVGSGKTVVALLTAMIAADNGFQTAIMVPTEILAEQHFESISRMCAKTKVKIALLTGSSKIAERRQIDEGLMSGDIDIIVGTHALIEDKVQFKNLGYVIIDEQHRFGVAQRGKIWHKGFSTPHVLVMTATPIPRTLAMTIYGDLDVSVIDSKPVGRKPIITKWVKEEKRFSVYNFMKKEISSGHQVYVVFPLINESETLDYKNLYDGAINLESFFPHPEYSNVVVHGQMSPEMKDYGMKAFKDGKAQILISTTVIEVGVDVPNATIILIESAERFGLSQLHQLRGRVGRSDKQSYCILMTGDSVSSQTAQRMRAMESTNNGFELSELDLKLRGAGDMDGIRQSGQKISLRVANPFKDTELLNLATTEATNILNNDPSLLHPDNKLLLKLVETTNPPSSEFDFGTIS